MTNKRYGFVVTKPLQLLIAWSIANQIDSNILKSIIIVDSFVDSMNVYDRIKKKSLNSISFKYAQNHAEAYRHLRHARYDKIFIDSDVGGRKFITLFLHKIFNLDKEIVVYEEGIATYLVNLDGYGKLFKFLRFFGVGTHFGGSIFVSEIFLYQTILYSKIFKKTHLRVTEIEKKLSDFIDENFIILLSIFGVDLKNLMTKIGDGDSCTLYLTEWMIDFELIDYLTHSGKIVIKLHPHLNNINKLESFNCVIISGSLPAEVLLKYLSLHFKKIKIYHHGSSVEHYISGESFFYIRRKMLSF